MPRTRKVLSKQNLYKLPILIQDTGVESTYFNIKQLSGVFTGGKNGFLISGTSLLKPGTEILIELIDSSGNSIYTEAIRGFVEGGARLVSVEVYPDTASGPAILTIVGTALKTNTGVELSEVETEKPNVRWQKKIIIEPRNRNITPIRLKKLPELYVSEELLNPFEFSQSIFNTSNRKFELTPKFELAKQAGYAVKLISSGIFVTGSRFYNSILTGSLFLETRQYTSSIPFTTSSYTVLNSDTASINLPLSVINRTRALTNKNITSSISKNILNIPILLSGSYEITSSQYSSSNGTLYYQTVTAVTGSVNYQYTSIPSIVITSGKKSFANIKLINLDTVTGELYRIKTSFKRAESNDEFAFLSDALLKVNELLVVSSSNTYERQKPIGLFDDIFALGDYWYGYKITGSTIPDPSYYTSSISSSFQYPLYINSNLLFHSGHVSGAYDNYFFGTKNTFPVFSTSEYTLKFDSVVTSSITTNLSTAPDFNLDIYLIGSAIVDKNPLGKKIGNITRKATDIAMLTDNSVNFTVPRNGDIGIRFIPTNGYWQFANISLKVAEEYAFNPDEVTYLIPNQLMTSASVIFKVELFDINNNSINLNVVSQPTYFTGSTV